jgi:hypothetical protein
MAKPKNQSLVDNVRSTLGQVTKNGRRGSRNRSGLGSQASGFIAGLLSGGSANNNRSRSRGRRGR